MLGLMQNYEFFTRNGDMGKKPNFLLLIFAPCTVSHLLATVRVGLRFTCWHDLGCLPPKDSAILLVNVCPQQRARYFSEGN